jgi:SAM-dependent methyltransferase
MALESLKECPICNSQDLQPFLICEDHTATNETFQLLKCARCTFVVTSPRPAHTSISKYYDSENYISHTGKPSSAIDSIYLLVRKFTLRWKMTLIARYTGKPATLLDFGCGTGDFLTVCSAGGWNAYGIEPSAASDQKASTESRVMVLKSIEELPPLKFEVITLWHVLEHLADLENKINQLKNLLTVNGTLFVAVPNRTSYDAQVYKEKWAAYDVPRHLWHFSIENMEQLMTRSRLSIKEIIPMKLDAYYIGLLSQKYKTGKSTFGGALKALSIALSSNLRARKTNRYSSLIYIIKK